MESIALEVSNGWLRGELTTRAYSEAMSTLTLLRLHVLQAFNVDTRRQMEGLRTAPTTDSDTWLRMRVYEYSTILTTLDRPLKECSPDTDSSATKGTGWTRPFSILRRLISRRSH